MHRIVWDHDELLLSALSSRGYSLSKCCAVVPSRHACQNKYFMQIILSTISIVKLSCQKVTPNKRPALLLASNQLNDSMQRATWVHDTIFTDIYRMSSTKYILPSTTVYCWGTEEVLPAKNLRFCQIALYYQVLPRNTMYLLK